MPRPMPLGQFLDICEGFLPVDLNGGANNSDWISVKNAAGILVLHFSAVGTAGSPQTITTLQAKTNAGGSSKAINIKTAPSHCYKKQAATNLQGTTVWSDASADCSTNTWVGPGGSGNQPKIVAIWFDAEEFDMDNGFYFLEANIAAPGATMLGMMLMLPIVEYPNSPANVLSALG